MTVRSKPLPSIFRLSTESTTANLMDTTVYESALDCLRPLLGRVLAPLALFKCPLSLGAKPHAKNTHKATSLDSNKEQAVLRAGRADAESSH